MSRTTAHLHGAQTDDTPVHQALREALANCLVHADYFGQQGVVITKSPRLLTFTRNYGIMKSRSQFGFATASMTLKNGTQISLDDLATKFSFGIKREYLPDEDVPLFQAYHAIQYAMEQKQSKGERNATNHSGAALRADACTDGRLRCKKQRTEQFRDQRKYDGFSISGK